MVTLNCTLQARPPSLHHYCAVVLHSCIVLPPVGHSSYHEYHCCHNRAVFRIFVALLRFSFDSPSDFYGHTNSVKDGGKLFLGPNSLLRDEACSSSYFPRTRVWARSHRGKLALVNLRYDRLSVCVIAPPTGRISMKFDVCSFYKNLSRKSRCGESRAKFQARCIKI